MTEWSDFFTSSSITSSSSSSKISSFSNNQLFLRFSFFQNIDTAIRVTSTNSVQSLISEVIFSDCYSSEDGGAIYYSLEKGESVMHKVCGYNCYSLKNRAFGYVISKVGNYLNFSSFLFCPSTEYNNKPFGSITLTYGIQVSNNVNASQNHGSAEGGIIFDHQTINSKIIYVLCIDSHCPGSRLFYVGKNVLVLSCTVIRCSSLGNLIHFSGTGEIHGCNIIECEADYSIGCISGVSQAFDIFISNDLSIDTASVTLVRKLNFTVLHPHLVLKTYHCWDGILFCYTSPIMEPSQKMTLAIFVLLNKT